MPSTISSPLQFFRSEDFTIASTIVHNCSNSLSVSVQWIVYNCTNTTCSSSPIDVHPAINTRSTEFFVPPKSLPIGLYRLIYIVTITDRPHLVSSIQTHLHIHRTGIILNLLPHGTPMMSRGTLQDIYFNPGHYSLDLDQDDFDSSVRHHVDLALYTDMMMCCRHGNTPITVGGLMCGTILDLKVFSCLLTMLISIHPHLRVSSIEQVRSRHFLSLSHTIYLFQIIK